jgi:hypothetical protein
MALSEPMYVKLPTFSAVRSDYDQAREASIQGHVPSVLFWEAFACGYAACICIKGLWKHVDDPANVDSMKHVAWERMSRTRLLHCPILSLRRLGS